jgi:hypothetical protein
LFQLLECRLRNLEESIPIKRGCYDIATAVVDPYEGLDIVVPGSAKRRFSDLASSDVEGYATTLHILIHNLRRSVLPSRQDPAADEPETINRQIRYDQGVPKPFREPGGKMLILTAKNFYWM